MTNPSALTQLSQRLSLVPVLVGGLVILGWVFNLLWLTTLHPTAVSMKYNAAVGFEIAGLALYMRHRSQRIGFGYRLAAVSLVLLGLLTLIEYSLSINLGIDEGLMRDLYALPTASAGRMAPNTAICFLFLGTILLLDGTQILQHKRLMSGLALSIALMSGLVILGYTYHVDEIDRVADLITMAFPTAILFFLLSFVALSLNPGHPLLRAAAMPEGKNFFWMILFIPIASWVRIQGQFRFGLYGTDMGLALLTLFFIVLWLIVIVRSMTIIRQQKQHIQDQHLLHKSILSNMSEGVLVVDTQHSFQYFNPAAERILGVGVTNDGPAGWPLSYGVFHPDTMQSYEVNNYPLMQALNGTPIDDAVLFICNAQRPEGLYINVSARPLTNKLGTIMGAVAVLRDISEKRRQSQAQLKASNYERSLSNALTLFNTGIEQQDMSHTLLYQLGTNHAFAVSAYYEYRPEQQQYVLVAHYSSASVIKQDTTFDQQRLAALLTFDEHGILVTQSLAELCLLLGITEQPLAMLLCPVNYFNQKLGLLVLTANDPLDEVDLHFSQRLATQLAVALNKINQQNLKVLNSKLRQYNLEVSHKNQLLEHASKIKSEFLANMSHELRTPLNAIIGFSEILRDGIVGGLSSDQVSYVTEIYDSGEHLLSLINDILDLSKVEAGMMSIDLSPVDVESLLQGSFSVIKEKALKRSITLTLDIAQAPAHIMADGRKLKQIVYNLLSNAIKFTLDHGEIQLVAQIVASEDRQLHVPHMEVYQLPAPDTEAQHFLEIRVLDTGIGIEAADLQRLFQPFTQIDSSLSRQFEGSGLGLELIRRMVELHGGSVAVASAPQLGSCFAVWLPLREVELADALVTSQPDQSEPTHCVNNKLLALVVEDSPQATDILRHYLEEVDFTVITAPNAAQALAIMAKSLPDLITLDLFLPDLNGWDILKLIQDDTRLVDIPVVIVSMEANSSNCMALGAAKALQKPLRREELITTLRALGLKTDDSPKFTVLAVDDDPHALTIIDSYLAAEKNITLLHANNGLEALTLIKQAVPDLLIVDLLMPVMNGFEVVAHLKDMPSTASLPIVVVSSKEITNEERQWLSDQNVLQIIPKSPFNSASFLNEVRRALQR
jgi:PAS domain S-box-containing protein